MKKLLFILILLPIELIAQNGVTPFRLWELMSKSGTFNVRGHYRELDVSDTELINSSQNSFYSGGLKFNTRSSVLHSNFLALDVGGEYNTGTNRENYLVSPDHAESLTTKKLNLRGGFFEKKPMNISTYLNLNQNYTNREYVNSTKTDSEQWGLNYSFRNKIAPINVSYSRGKWNQREVETGRTIRNRQSTLRSNATTSFSSSDSHDLGYSHSEYVNRNINLTKLVNKVDKIYLNNNVFFDAEKKYSYRSSISNLHQEGTYGLDRFIVRQNIAFDLPENFRLTGKYDFQKNEQQTQQYDQNIFFGRLDHQLFTSLKTGVFFQNQQINHVAYQEYNNRSGFNVDYTKKIPRGILKLSFASTKRHQGLESEPGALRIFDEIHVLSDNELVLLDRPFIDPESVLITNENGTIVYEINFDYVLIAAGDYLEIQRIPGGQILDNAVLNIDYSVALNGSFSYDADHRYFSASVLLFDRLIKFYYNTTNQDFGNETVTDAVTLNRFNKNTYGSRLEIGIFSAGVEFNYYESNIIPYQRSKYYVQLNGQVTKQVMLSLNGNISKTHLTEVNLDQIFSNVYGKVTYLISQKSKMNFDLGYRKQEGKQIDLDLITARGEYIASYRDLFFTIGLEMYRRAYVGTKTNFSGGYFQLERRF